MPSELLVLWRSRRVVGDQICELRCTVEQLGEGCFELCVRLGDGLLVSETFPSTQDLPRRAEELRLALAPPRGTGRGLSGGAPDLP